MAAICTHEFFTWYGHNIVLQLPWPVEVWYVCILISLVLGFPHGQKFPCGSFCGFTHRRGNLWHDIKHVFINNEKLNHSYSGLHRQELRPALISHICGDN